MRIASSIFVLLAASTLAACAGTNVTARGSDTAVRAEPRRISDGSFLPDALKPSVQATHRQTSL